MYSSNAYNTPLLHPGQQEEEEEEEEEEEGMIKKVDEIIIQRGRKKRRNEKVKREIRERGGAKPQKKEYKFH